MNPLFLILVCIFNCIYTVLLSQQITTNQKEFNKAIIEIESQIWGMKNYLVDTSSVHWTAKDPIGYYNFEGTKYTNPDSIIYSYRIKLTSRFSSDDYFENEPSIAYTYSLRNKKVSEVLSLGSEAFENLPFTMEDTKLIFKEKEIILYYSESLVFDQYHFEEKYIVTYKNDTKVMYWVDGRNRTFRRDTLR